MTPVPPGHGVTSKRLNELCEQGIARPLGDMVLVRAIMEAHATPESATLAEGITIDARDAVAWRVVACGSHVPPDVVAVGDTVTSISLAGDSVTIGSPYRLVRLEHLILNFGNV